MKKENVFFILKTFGLTILLNIFSVIVLIPFVLAKTNQLFIYLLGTLLYVIAFTIALYLMYRSSKLSAQMKYENGIYTLGGLVLLQLWGLIRNRTPYHFMSEMLFLLFGYIAIRLLSQKKL